MINHKHSSYSTQKSFWFRKFNKIYYTTDGYDDYLERFKQEGLDYALRLVRQLKLPLSWRFLDVGCGMGGIVLGLRNLGYEAWGTEVSPYCLRFSPAKNWIHFGDMLHLPFSNQSFAVIIYTDVLCYLTKEEVKQAIKD